MHVYKCMWRVERIHVDLLQGVHLCRGAQLMHTEKGKGECCPPTPRLYHWL